MDTTTPVFEVRDLEVGFRVFRGHLRVLDRANLVVEHGEKVGLVGETGCGKSITMKATIGILPIPPAHISGGAILIDGRDILKLRGRALRHTQGLLSLIPQDPSASLNPVFRIGTQLADAIKYSAVGANLSRREIRRRSIEILGEVGLPDPQRNLASYPVQMSGGMKQRVLIAMALVTDPLLLIADEPTTALDVTIEAQILCLMREAVDRRGVSILLITHNLGVVREFTDRVYIMYAGQVSEKGATSDLFSTPLHPYTKGLIASVPKLTGEGVAAGIDGMVPDYLDVPSGCRFSPRCSHAMPVCSEKPEMRLPEATHGVACHLFPTAAEEVKPCSS